jgi:hypothetical protein
MDLIGEFDVGLSMIGVGLVSVVGSLVGEKLSVGN